MTLHNPGGWKSGLPFALAALLSVTSLHVSAVSLGTDDQGEVLVFPYYAATESADTLISIFNHRERGKVLRVRFIDGQFGKTALEFNLYLGPRDAWSGAVSSVAGAPQIVFSDLSCLISSEGLQLKNRFDYPSTLDVDYVDPVSASVGYLEVFEMGELPEGLLPRGIFDRCEIITAAFGDGGIWADDHANQVSSPKGGLSGHGSIISVNEGLQWGYTATAIDQFFEPADDSTDWHVSANERGPDLRDIDSSAVTGDADLAQSIVWDGDKKITAHWDVSIRDARSTHPVGSLLAAATVANEVLQETTIAALTDWVVSHPTLRYHVEDSFAQSAPEFGQALNLHPPYNQEVTVNRFGIFVTGERLLWDREGIPAHGGQVCMIVCFDETYYLNPGPAGLLLFNEPAAGLGTGTPSHQFGTALATYVSELGASLLASGTSQIDFSRYSIRSSPHRTVHHGSSLGFP